MHRQVAHLFYRFWRRVGNKLSIVSVAVPRFRPIGELWGASVGGISHPE